MGLRVNLFIAAVAILACFNIPCFILLVLTLSFTVLYNYWKNWKFIVKFPGGRGISVRGLLESSPNGFFENLNRLWCEHGRDKFVVWIGMERFVAVSKFDDIKAVLNAGSDAGLIERFDAMWPWIGGDCIKLNDFTCSVFTSVITSTALNELTKSPAFVEHMSKRFGALCKHNIASGEVVDIQDLARIMMFDILVLIATGNNVGPQRKEMFEQAEKLTSQADQLTYSGIKQSAVIRALLLDTSRLSKSRANFINHISNSLSTENNLIANSVFKVLKQSHPEVNAATFISIFVILGYERFSVAFTSLILELARDAELQEQLCREVRANSRYFMACENLEKFLVEKMTKIPATPVVVKSNELGVALNGFFVPPNTGVLLYLQNAETYGRLMREIGESLTMNLMKLFVGEFVVRCRFQLEDGKTAGDGLGCGLSLRRKSARILVRNRY